VNDEESNAAQRKKMNAKLDHATIARNVRKWRHEHAKRAVRLEIRQREAAPSDTEVELLVAHHEAKSFSQPIPLP
jgi:hypothetical protein